MRGKHHASGWAGVQAVADSLELITPTLTALFFSTLLQMPLPKAGHQSIPSQFWKILGK